MISWNRWTWANRSTFFLLFFLIGLRFLFCPWSKCYPYSLPCISKFSPKFHHTKPVYKYFLQNQKTSTKEEKICPLLYSCISCRKFCQQKVYPCKRFNHKDYMLRVKLSLTPGFFCKYWLESICTGTSNVNLFFFSLPGLQLWLIRRWKAPDPLPIFWAIQSAFAITLNLLILKYFLMLLFIHLLCAI